MVRSQRRTKIHNDQIRISAYYATESYFAKILSIIYFWVSYSIRNIDISNNFSAPWFFAIHVIVLNRLLPYRRPLFYALSQNFRCNKYYFLFLYSDQNNIVVVEITIRGEIIIYPCLVLHRYFANIYLWFYYNFNYRKYKYITLLN